MPHPQGWLWLQAKEHHAPAPCLSGLAGAGGDRPGGRADPLRQHGQRGHGVSGSLDVGNVAWGSGELMGRKLEAAVLFSQSHFHPLQAQGVIHPVKAATRWPGWGGSRHHAGALRGRRWRPLTLCHPPGEIGPLHQPAPFA
ncbi:hypothetical protein KIL84_020932, partial [Mauremys mutica]